MYQILIKIIIIKISLETASYRARAVINLIVSNVPNHLMEYVCCTNNGVR